MMFLISQMSDEANGIFHAAGYLTQSQCDHTAQELLDQAPRRGITSLDGSDDDLTRVNHIKQVIEAISKDSA